MFCRPEIVRVWVNLSRWDSLSAATLFNCYSFILEPADHYWLWGKCRHRLCKCDAAAAECFAKSPYQNKYKRYPKEQKCKENTRAEA